jgi:hypothetical protein
MHGGCPFDVAEHTWGRKTFLQPKIDRMNQKQLCAVTRGDQRAKWMDYLRSPWHVAKKTEMNQKESPRPC